MEVPLRKKHFVDAVHYISFPELLPEEDWYQVDVITYAAPNLRRHPSNFMNPNAGDKPASLSNISSGCMGSYKCRKVSDS